MCFLHAGHSRDWSGNNSIPAVKILCRKRSRYSPFATVREGLTFYPGCPLWSLLRQVLSRLFAMNRSSEVATSNNAGIWFHPPNHQKNGGNSHQVNKAYEVAFQNEFKTDIKFRLKRAQSVGIEFGTIGVQNGCPDTQLPHFHFFIFL